MNINIQSTNYSVPKSKQNQYKTIAFTSKPEPDDLKKLGEMVIGEAIYQSIKPKAIRFIKVGGKKLFKSIDNLIKSATEALENLKTELEKQKETDKTKKLTDMLLGNQNPAGLKKSAEEVAEEAMEISKKRMSFPELISHREERSAIIKKNRVKEDNNQLDLDYYKDNFRAYVTIPVDRLNSLRTSTNPELKKMFNIDRNNFMIDAGIMIHGSDRPEKKQLFEHFITEAKKHDMDVIHIPAGDSDPEIFTQNIAKLFPKAKENFLNNKKATMFVMEDVDKMLNLKDERLSVLNGPCRASINVHTNKCGMDGVMWVSTVKDISQIDPSCHSGGGGRVSKIINIDNAVKVDK